MLLKARHGTLDEQAPQLVAEERDFQTASASEYAAVGGLGEAVDPSRHANSDHWPSIDLNFIDGVTTWVPYIAKDLHDRVFSSLVELAAGDRTVVLHSDKDNPAVRVGEGDNSFL